MTLATIVLALALAAPRAGGGDAPAAAAPIAGAPATLGQGERRTIELQVGRSTHIAAPWPAKGASLTDPAIADVQVLTPRLIQVSARAPGRTNVLVWSEDSTTLELEIVVTPDLAWLAQELERLFPASGITLSQSHDVVLVNGVLERAEQAEQLRRYLTATKTTYVDLTSLGGVQQVQVQVRLAEVSRVGLRQLGVNGVVAGSDGFFGSNIGASGQMGIAPLVGAPVTGNVPFAFQDTSINPSVTLFGGLSRGDLEIFVQALAENRYLRILAEPSLTALSGAEASFLAGGEIPIPVIQGGGGGNAASSITIQFKPFGIGLKFRPTVLGDGAIRIELSSEVSEVTEGISESTTQFGGIRVPGILTRRAESTLELKSGQTFAIAGLLSERINAQSSRIPWFGDLPVLGTLFRSVQYRKGETELLVLVTASLVEPISEAELPAMPGDTHVAPEDWELYLHGRLESKKKGTAWSQHEELARLKGPGAWMSHGQPPALSTAQTTGADSHVREPSSALDQK